MQKIREIQEESLAQTLRRIWKAALTSILTSFAVLGIFGFLFTGMFTLFTWFAASTVLSVAWVFNQVIGLRATQMSKAVGEKYQAVRQRAVRQIRDWQKEVNDHILKEAKAAVANGLKVAAAPFKEVAEHVQKNRSRYAFGLVLTAGIILVIALRSRIKRVVQRFMSKAKAEGKHTVDKQGIVDGILTVLTTSTLVVGAIGVIVDMTTMKKVVEALRHMHAVKAAVIACSGVIAFLSKSSLALLDLFGLTSLFQVEKIAEKVKNGSKSLDHMCDFDILEPADVRFFADALEADQVPNPDKKKDLLKKLAEKRAEKNLEKWEFDRDACEYVPACIFDYEKYGTYGFIDDPKDGVVYKVHESTPTYLSDEGDHVRHLTPGLWKYHKSTHDFVRIGDSDDDEFDTVAVPWRKCLIREVPDKLVIKKPLPFSFSEDGEVFSEPTINMMRADIFVKFEVESERRKARKVAAEIRKINARIEGKDEKLEKEKEKEKEKEMEDIHLDQVGHKTELDYNHYVKWIALVLLVLALSIGAYYVYNYIWKEEQLEQGEKKIPALGAKKVEETPAAQPQPARAFDGNKRGQDYWKKRHAAKAECIHMPDCPKKMGVVSDKDCNIACGGHHCTHFLTCNPHNNKEIAALATKTIPEGGNSYQKLTGCQAPEAEGVIRGKNKRRGKHRKMMSDADYLEWKRQQRQQELQRIREADYDLGEDFGNDYEGGYFGGSWGEYMDDYEDYHRQARAEGIEEFPDFVPYDDHYQDLCAYLKDEDEWVLVAPESRFHAMYPKFTDWLKRKKDTVQGWFQKTQEQPTEKTVEEIKNKPAQESKQKNKPLQKVAEGPSKNANKQQQKQKQANEPKERGKKVTFQESSKPSRDFSKIPCNNSSCKGTFKMQLFDEKRRPRKGPGGNPLFTEIPCKYNHDHLKKEKGKEKEHEKPRPESRIATSLICPTNISEDKHAIVKINEKDQEWIKNGNAFGLQGGLFSLKHVGYKNPVVLEQWARNGAEKEVEETVTFKEYTKASWGSERIIWAPKTQSYNKYKFGIPQEGEECWVVGWDVTNPNQPVFVRTSGHVHGPRDEYKFTLGPDHMTHTCTTKFGMSACPVLNHKGEVIGLHWGGTGDSAAYNAFIPFTKQMVADFGSGGHSMTPY